MILHMQKGDHGGDYHQGRVGPNSAPSDHNLPAVAARGNQGSSADNARAVAARKNQGSSADNDPSIDVSIFTVPGQSGIENHDTQSAELDDELVPEEGVDGTPADAAGTSTEAERISPEWSEGDERLLKLLLGPGREPIPNTPFRRSELNDIDDRLQEVMEQLTEMKETLKITDGQLKAMKTTLDEAREASERIGREDWLLFAIGTLTTFAISAAFSPATVVYIAKLFIHKVVAHLFVEQLAG